MPALRFFCRFELRTTRVEAARGFYEALLGRPCPDITPLPEQAIARGAVPHWLGHIDVEEPEGVARAFVERGAVRLGPTRKAPGGGEDVVLRDPGGAVVAITSHRPATTATVAWHQLHTTHLAQAITSYRELFGWSLTHLVNHGASGMHQRFARQAGGESVGSMVDVAALRGVHPHWLFYFPVADLDPAMTAVRAAGGIVIGPTVLTSGIRVAVCDDPQGAAFGLVEAKPGADLSASS